MRAAVDTSPGSADPSKEVRDRAGTYTLILSVLGVLFASATWVVGMTSDEQTIHTAARFALWVLGASVAVLGYLKWRNEKAFKAQEQRHQDALADLLRAERVRLLTITNGAFQTSAEQLQNLAAMDIHERRREVSGFRQSTVNKACDLVRNDSPRSAYFKVEDLHAPQRRMGIKDSTSRNRTDQFTTEFVEGSGIDENVWPLIDSGDAQLVNDVATEAPAEFDTSRPRAYKSYISIPVRAGAVAFGMLTINSIEQDGFTDEDLAALNVLARLLGAAEVIAMSSQEWNIVKQARGPATLSEGRGTLAADKEAT